MAAPFDATAPTFDRYRALPVDVPNRVRAAVWQAIGMASPRVLDLGAGTGRFGKVFVAAGDSYLGIDLSFAMLREFRAASSDACLLQADGERLPLRDEVFDAVMLMQVLSGASQWRGLLSEARRVLRSGGMLIVGQGKAPADGVDARMKNRLAEILEEMNVEERRGGKGREKALDWLASAARRRLHVVGATWEAQPRPRDFLVRHRTGARFAALPVKVQDESLHKLSAWAEGVFGSLDLAVHEQHSFELDIFEF